MRDFARIEFFRRCQCTDQRPRRQKNTKSSGALNTNEMPINSGFLMLVTLLTSVDRRDCYQFQTFAQ